MLVYIGPIVLQCFIACTSTLHGTQTISTLIFLYLWYVYHWLFSLVAFSYIDLQNRFSNSYTRALLLYLQIFSAWFVALSCACCTTSSLTQRLCFSFLTTYRFLPFLKCLVPLDDSTIIWTHSFSSSRLLQISSSLLKSSFFKMFLSDLLLFNTMTDTEPQSNL